MLPPDLETDDALPRRSRWIAAAALGLISSSFSTIVSQIFAARIGRDAAVDWMTVAVIPVRDWALSAEPSWGAIVTGIAFHQWADFSWALVFFGVLGRWTADLRPWMILPLALPWAILTSGMEWFVLVPLFPFWQPLFTLQQPYWIGFLVHASSALMYPLFVRLRWIHDAAPAQMSRSRMPGAPGAGRHRGARRNRAVRRPRLRTAVGGARQGHGPGLYPPHHRSSRAGHRAGSIGCPTRAGRPSPEARQLMAASQIGETRIFSSWWRIWFANEMPDCSSAERAAMPGFLTTNEVQQAKNARPTHSMDCSSH